MIGFGRVRMENEVKKEENEEESLMNKNWRLRF